jgi:hypothetical protein
MGLFRIRAPFAVHLAWFDTVPDGKTSRRVRREKSHFHGEDPVELSDTDAIAHMHKLEPVDAAAVKLFGDFYDRQAALIAARQGPAPGQSLAQEVTGAVIGALIGAGLIKPKHAVA